MGTGAESQNGGQRGLKPYLSPLNIWGFSLGTSVGWGSLVVTSNTYLSSGGLMGSVIGLIAGALIMFFIAESYGYLTECYPDAGGAYAYTREAFGYDHGFLVAWFLMLTYLAVFWANATSLPLFARYFLGGFFHVGIRYTIFGYEVYLAEAVFASAAIVLTAFICIKSRKLSAAILTVMVCIFSVGITICFLAAFTGHGSQGFRFEPMYLPDKNALNQMVRIACISPWAFIGFENVSHFAEEFTFSKNRIRKILRLAVISTAALYIFIIVLSVSAYPPEYANWLEYIRDLDSLDGIKGLPAFYAADHYLGNAGVTILMLALLSLVVTSLIGNLTALSRLFYALGRDGIIGKRFAEVNQNHSPKNAILLAAVISVFIPLLGRTAIGWIIDVTTLGATIIYGFVSAAAMRVADIRGDRKDRRRGVAGLIFMIGIALYILLPNLFSDGQMETESYFLFAVWAILGFIFFRYLLKGDQTKRFGKSIIVWVGLLSLVLFISLVWMSRSTMQSTGLALEHVKEYLSDEVKDPALASAEEIFIERELRTLQQSNVRSMMIVIGLFALSLATLLNIYTLMSRRAEESEVELGNVKRLANTDPLTGVKSKRAFAEKEKQMDEEIGKGSLAAFSVVVCDVNGLKYVNDTYGHKAGDEYICSASRIICELFQHSPVFRIGGDEFVVILTGRDFDSRDAIMEELHRRVEQNISTGEVVIAAGISDFDPGRDRDIHAVFGRADSLMYSRKKELKAKGSVSR